MGCEGEFSSAETRRADPVRAFSQEFDTELTRDILELVEREVDLLNRGRKNASLAGAGQTRSGPVSLTTLMQRCADGWQTCSSSSPRRPSSTRRQSGCN